MNQLLTIPLFTIFKPSVSEISASELPPHEVFVQSSISDKSFESDTGEG